MALAGNALVNLLSEVTAYAPCVLAFLDGTRAKASVQFESLSHFRYVLLIGIHLNSYHRYRLS
jgi:hypothetical protein